MSALSRTANIVVPMLILGAGFGGCFALANLRKSPQPRDIVSKAPLVKTIPVASAESKLDVDVDGTVVPVREIQISSEVEGKIEYQSDDCRAGRYVKKGDVLIRVNQKDYQLAMDLLKSELKQRQTEVAELKVEIKNTEELLRITQEELTLRDREVTRQQQLQKRGAGTAVGLEEAQRNEIQSRNSVTNMQSQLRLLQAKLPRMEQAVELAKTQLADAKLDFDRTDIRSPIDGMIVSSSVEQDAYLKKGDPVVVVEDTSVVEVVCYLEMRVVSWLRTHPPEGWTPAEGPAGSYAVPKTPATVTYDVLGNTYSWTGTLSRYEGTGVDRQTRTVPCRVTISDPQAVSLLRGGKTIPIAAPPALVRGMFVDVRLHTTPKDAVLSLPEVAVRPGNIIWVARDSKLEVHKLPLTVPMDGEVLIPADTAPVKPGDRLIVSPLPVPTPGMAIREETGDSSAYASIPDESDRS
ncbi:efflux RND transporter periplasmic adaptor subunit [Calycomorphotria hydatis]|uniref:Multidrug export protein EmrA n=1 Tax=Calycomorphotria hydatis TaxID=2528027 RepID=A0A517T7U7_9PLAN|nr:HlyD family efflux transporter periplasmic adaptor subunit [Calycomorphotria hydatis]QDT64448.1 Multidrug export protein EmrA [Calycomorphotria hydatis]